MYFLLTFPRIADELLQTLIMRARIDCEDAQVPIFALLYLYLSLLLHISLSICFSLSRFISVSVSHRPSLPSSSIFSRSLLFQRLLIVALHGLAGVAMLNNNPAEAAQYYRAVLAMGKKSRSSGGIETTSTAITSATSTIPVSLPLFCVYARARVRVSFTRSCVL